MRTGSPPGVFWFIAAAAVVFAIVATTAWIGDVEPAYRPTLLLKIWGAPGLAVLVALLVTITRKKDPPPG